MALNGPALGDAIKAATDALTDAQKANRVTLFEAMGSAIVTYLVTNAQVGVTVSTTGTATAQTGTGHGTIT
jgi:hypothetical protein